jgi:hypothetical protein
MKEKLKSKAKRTKHLKWHIEAMTHCEKTLRYTYDAYYLLREFFTNNKFIILVNQSKVVHPATVLRQALINDLYLKIAVMHDHKTINIKDIVVRVAEKDSIEQIESLHKEWGTGLNVRRLIATIQETASRLEKPLTGNYLKSILDFRTKRLAHMIFSESVSRVYFNHARLVLPITATVLVSLILLLTGRNLGLKDIARAAERNSRKFFQAIAP